LGTAAAGLAWVPLWLAVTRSTQVRQLLAPRPPETKAERAAVFRWGELLRDPAVLRCGLAIIATAPTLAFAIAWGAKILVDQHHLPQRAVGRYLWLPPVFFDLASIGVGALATLLARRAGRRRPEGEARGAPGTRLLVGVCAVLCASMAALGVGATPLSTTLLLGLAMAGGGGVYALATAELMRRVAPSLVAVSGGMLVSAQSLAHICTNPLVGMARDRGWSFPQIAVFVGLWALPGCVAWLSWPSRVRRIHDEGGLPC
jgi:hypothetical protein